MGCVEYARLLFRDGSPNLALGANASPSLGKVITQQTALLPEQEHTFWQQVFGHIIFALLCAAGKMGLFDCARFAALIFTQFENFSAPAWAYPIPWSLNPHLCEDLYKSRYLTQPNQFFDPNFILFLINKYGSFGAAYVAEVSLLCDHCADQIAASLPGIDNVDAARIVTKRCLEACSYGSNPQLSAALEPPPENVEAFQKCLRGCNIDLESVFTDVEVNMAALEEGLMPLYALVRNVSHRWRHPNPLVSCERCPLDFRNPPLHEAFANFVGNMYRCQVQHCIDGSQCSIGDYANQSPEPLRLVLNAIFLLDLPKTIDDVEVARFVLSRVGLSVKEAQFAADNEIEAAIAVLRIKDSMIDSCPEALRAKLSVEHAANCPSAFRAPIPVRSFGITQKAIKSVYERFEGEIPPDDVLPKLVLQLLVGDLDLDSSAAPESAPPNPAEEPAQSIDAVEPAPPSAAEEPAPPNPAADPAPPSAAEEQPAPPNAAEEPAQSIDAVEPAPPSAAEEQPAPPNA
ncbi:MAG: hypothetical protein LBC42_02785, partial [Puniceicoccales bacterium]|nr:hypothetical protein [Puniceicoccales bacterium]